MSRRNQTQDPPKEQVLLGFGTNFFYALGNDESSEDVILRHSDDEPPMNDGQKQTNEEEEGEGEPQHAADKENSQVKADSTQHEEAATPQTTTTHVVKARRLHSSSFARRDNAASSEDPPTIQQIVCTATASVFLTSSGQIYQCGMIHGSINPSPTKMELHLPLHCTNLAAGRHFCLALVEGGVGVCSFGAGHFGQLGHGPQISHLEEPQLIPHLLPRVLSNRRVSSIAAGTWHAAAILSDGQAFTWGSNRHGQCCCVVSGNTSSKSPPTLTIPTPVDTEIRFSQMSLGRFHSVGLQKTTGRVFTFGSNHHGQCGHTSSRSGKSSRQVRLVESLQRVCMVQIAAGDLHTLALTGGGRVFSWGCGLDGQLGVVAGNAVWPRSRPRLVGDLDFVAIAAGGEDYRKQQASYSGGAHPLSTVPRIVSVQAAGNYSVAVSSSGHVYSWGSNDTGALGLPTPTHLELVDPLNLTQEQNMNLLSNKTSGQRTLEAKTFDSGHNVWLPRRLDALTEDYHVEGVAAGPGHLWCWGHRREQGENIIVGQTLYELQEERRRKGMETTEIVPLSQQEYRSSMATETPDDDEQGQLIMDGNNDPTLTLPPPIASAGSTKGTLPANSTAEKTDAALTVPKEQRPHGGTGLPDGEARVADDEDGFVDVGSVGGSSTSSSDAAPLAVLGRKLSLGGLFGKKKKKSKVPDEEKRISADDGGVDNSKQQNQPPPKLEPEPEPEPEPELLTNLEDSYSC